MKRILIGVLLVILGTSYIVQKEHILKELSTSLTDRMRATPVVVKEKHKPEPQQFDLMAYPAPEDSWPYIPPPDSSRETPLPTFTPLPFPTPAPTMNPWGD